MLCRHDRAAQRRHSKFFQETFHPLTHVVLLLKFGRQKPIDNAYKYPVYVFPRAEKYTKRNRMLCLRAASTLLRISKIYYLHLCIGFQGFRLIDAVRSIFAVYKWKFDIFSGCSMLACNNVSGLGCVCVVHSSSPMRSETGKTSFTIKINIRSISSHFQFLKFIFSSIRCAFGVRVNDTPFRANLQVNSHFPANRRRHQVQWPKRIKRNEKNQSN